MPKLDNATAKKVNQAEGSGTTLLDEDQYKVKLEKVIVSPKPDKNGNSYWVWTFSVVSGQTTGDKFKGKQLRTNTGLSDNQFWYMKMIFDAFGAKPNVDTDTLLGQEVLSIVTQGEIQAGPRKGQTRNEMSSFEAVGSGDGDDDNWDDDSTDGGAADEDSEPDF